MYSVWDYGFGEKNLLNPVENGRENRVCQLVKNLLNSMKKRGRKSETLINEKPSNLMRKKRGKPIICCFVGSEKALKPS